MNTAQFSDVISTFEKVMSPAMALKMARNLDGAEAPEAAAALFVHVLRQRERVERERLESERKANSKSSEKVSEKTGGPYWSGRHIQSFGGGAGGGVRKPDRLPQTKTEFQSLKYSEILWIRENTPEIYSKFMSRDPWRT